MSLDHLKYTKYVSLFCNSIEQELRLSTVIVVVSLVWLIDNEIPATSNKVPEYAAGLGVIMNDKGAYLKFELLTNFGEDYFCIKRIQFFTEITYSLN